MTSPPGLDLEAVTAWFDATVSSGRSGPLTAALLTGGLSNLTYRLTDGETAWALRRPPLGHALPTAHDMAREHRIISALHGTAVPVAQPVALCEDVTVLGAPFYVMSFVDGVVLDGPDTIAAVTPDEAGRAGEVMVDTLLAVHATDAAAVGLGDLGRPDGFLARQLRRWSQQWEASVTGDHAAYDSVAAGLTTAMPEQAACGLVHGDYRLSNLILERSYAAVAAVVDWEMATLGDPLVDLGLMLVYQTVGNEGGFVLHRTPSSRGFLTPAEVLDRYASGTPRSTDAVDWYVAFGYWKLAVIAEGIHRRHLMGRTVGSGFDTVGSWVDPLLDRAAATLADSRPHLGPT